MKKTTFTTGKISAISSAFALVILASCGPNVPAEAVENSGIVATSRTGQNVTLLYQKSSTSDYQLQSEANRMCAKGGYSSAGNPRKGTPSREKGIPGVDAKIIYQCY